MEVKHSIYNFIVQDENREKFIVYNSRTGALALISQEQLDELNAFVQEEIDPEINKLAKQALTCGFIVPQKVDERFLVQTNIMLGRYNTARLSLTLAPTMACNFRCPYCFESGFHTHGCMSADVMAKVVTLAEQKMKGTKHFHVSWFGGEPLLAMPVIEKLTASFHKLCEQNHVDYSASIITNGYYYTKENAEKLKQLSVQRVQITIDGPQEVHDSRRFLVNGSPTYSVIMQNLIETHGILPVSLRINTDTDNVGAVNDVVAFLKANNLNDSVYPYLAPVVSHENAVTYNSGICMSEEEFSLQTLKFLQDNDLPVMNLYPRVVGNYCSADSLNSYAIDDKGNVSKCWEAIGDSRFLIGKLTNEGFELTDTDVIFRTLSFNPIYEADCQSCKLLPVCAGGCPKLRAEGRPRCHPLKGCLEDYLRAIANAAAKSKANMKNK